MGRFAGRCARTMPTALDAALLQHCTLPAGAGPLDVHLCRPGVSARPLCCRSAAGARPVERSAVTGRRLTVSAPAGRLSGQLR